MSATPNAPTNDQPIADFSQCHAGILRKLDALAELPALLAPAARAREIAEQSLAFFREAIVEHHEDEERELFPAVLASAAAGAERERVQGLVQRLTEEHRALERLWKQLEGDLKKVAKGQSFALDTAGLEALVAQYRSHACFEEAEFLPLAQAILGRNDNHLAALGLALHMRHTPVPVAGYV
ncbi:hemerythrin domain-containing protein [Tepidimonas taiwanensis]|nr:hemerythrin domain-containing protein [Tepidimonas taiwanensis]MCX7693412.1 hemerythrin domain-containing protein [Tepidimonas taiwanensis]MDM7463232.1 hemerythrin domain-containing protein [Tepidimonas taiwanensis]UBQ06493.1 hemerythrin domain-containing protein [Tepidimonas taiwanensis]